MDNWKIVNASLAKMVPILNLFFPILHPISYLFENYFIFLTEITECKIGLK